MQYEINTFAIVARWLNRTKIKKVPDQVLEPVVDYFLKHRQRIRNVWGWFDRVLTDAWHQYNARKNIEENAAWKATEPAPSLKEIMRNIGGGQ